jgi:hypothetical protein
MERSSITSLGGLPREAALQASQSRRTPPLLGGCVRKLKKGDIITIEGMGSGTGKKGQRIVNGRSVATGRKMKSVTPIELTQFVVQKTVTRRIK